MLKILIAFFNSLFFFALTVVFIGNLVIAGFVAIFVCIITIFSLCLATMAHRSNSMRYKTEHPQSSEDSSQLISHVFEERSNLAVSAKR